MNEINLVAPVNNLSYGYVAQNIIKALIQKGITINLKTLGPTDLDVEAGYDKFYEKCRTTLNPSCPTLIIWHHFDLHLFKDVPGSMKIGFPIFETDMLTESEVNSINTMDRIFTTCPWFERILKFHKIKPPISIVPLGVDPDIFSPSTPNSKKTVQFLHIGKWELRKSHPEIIKAFAMAQDKMPNATLTFASYNPFFNKENLYWRDYVAKHINRVAWNIYNQRLSSCREVSQLINGHDIYLAPSKAEGWNLPLLEAMYSNKLCIATNFSGHTAFCNKDNCLLLDATQTEKMFDGQWFFGNGNWAKIDIEQLSNLMVEAYSKAKSITNYSISESVKHLTWANTVDSILGVIC